MVLLYSMLREVRALKRLQHPNLVKYFGSSNYRDDYGFIGIIMEMVSGGNLKDLLRNKAIPVICMMLNFRFCQEIAEGLFYLHNLTHDKRITHGDIKPSNILLTLDLHCKIADFGSSTIQKHTEFGVETTTFCTGPLPFSEEYSAPERKYDRTIRYDTSMDVYSFGKVVVEIITRRFNGIDEVLLRITDTVDKCCLNEVTPKR